MPSVNVKGCGGHIKCKFFRETELKSLGRENACLPNGIIALASRVRYRSRISGDMAVMGALGCKAQSKTMMCHTIVFVYIWPHNKGLG